MTEFKVVQDQTSPIDIALYNDGELKDVSGMTLSLLLYDEKGVSHSISGSLATATATDASVRYSPSTGDLRRGTWRGRVQVVDGVGKVGYFPTRDPDSWKVYFP